MRALINRPGVSLFAVGVVLVIAVRQIVGAIWLIGGFLSTAAVLSGVAAILGGGALILLAARRT